ncbi:MAG: aspartate--tRNA ligase [Kosmotoga sp.]|nr:MAG: aspartate--tRNA ligase [Kosmotoga sp.]
MIERTDYCGNLRKSDCKRDVQLNGWIKKIRSFGKLLFVDLWDHSGLCQLVFEITDKNEKIADCIVGDCIGVHGKVVERKEINKNLNTGEIEVAVSDYVVYSNSSPMPIDRSKKLSEDIRLKYRYLDLRTDKMQKILRVRHNYLKAIREFLNKEKFVEVETPILSKSTPEGARDYVVPSRINKGNFYALPQSPQLYKQLLMIGGMDKYYQIARCFRDEDFRANRQAEFSQIDIEMSFIKEKDIIDLTERMIKYSFEKILDIDIQIPFQRMEYSKAISKYGTDKPDLRFGMEIKDLTDKIEVEGFKILENIKKDGKKIKAIKLKDEPLSRKNIDLYTEYVKDFGAKGLIWFIKENDNLRSSISKFLNDKGESIEKQMKMENDDTVLIIAGDENVTNESLGKLRLKLRDDFNLIDNNSSMEFVWITHFPMFEYSEKEKRYKANHHPFTMPYKEDIKKYKDSNPSKIRSYGYDIVLNGEEIGGGSIRNHINSLQKEVFDILEISPEEQEEKFGFFLKALQYGTPPHGGIAFGLERIIQILTDRKSIRDVIAFPKTTNASCLMTDSPGKITKKQLNELGIIIKRD